MNQDVQQGVQPWRDRAAEYRLLAAVIRDPSIVQSLERAARAYDGVADYVERKNQPRREPATDH
jgi:hypothetical protein